MAAFESSATVIQTLLGAMKDWVQDHRESLDRVGEHVILPSIRKNFQSEGRPRWAPLAPRTLRDRSRLGFAPGPILQRTGALMREASDKTSTHMAYVLKPRELVISLDPTFEKFQHQFGWAGVPLIPARPFFYLQPEDEVAAVETLARDLGVRMAQVVA